MGRLPNVVLIFAVLALTGCAPYWEHESLKKKVGDLEARLGKLESAKLETETEESDRRRNLNYCVNVEADQVFWDYVKLNATKMKDD